MLDLDFCELLEGEISKALANSSDDKLKYFWCDGVMLPTFENEYSKKIVNDNRKIIMTAFLGITGQDKYELTLNFGSKALSCYARNLDISKCLTNTDRQHWLDIDIEKRKITIQLD